MPALVGYIVALVCAYLVVARWCLAQPALLYIVPLSLWSVLLLAALRGELRLLWSVGPDPRWAPAPRAASRAPHGPREPAAPTAETLLPISSEFKAS